MTPISLLGVGLFYWAGSYTFALWLLSFLMANHVLGTARAYLDPSWYWQQRERYYFQHGWQPDYSVLDTGGNPPVSLLFSKVAVLAVELLIAWHIASRAGYL